MTDKISTDLDTPAPATISVDEWMRKENERQGKREAARLKNERVRYGKVSVNDHRRPRQRLMPVR